MRHDVETLLVALTLVFVALVGMWDHHRRMKVLDDAQRVLKQCVAFTDYVDRHCTCSGVKRSSLNDDYDPEDDQTQEPI